MPGQKRSYWREGEARRALAEIERRGEADAAYERRTGVPASRVGAWRVSFRRTPWPPSARCPRRPAQRVAATGAMGFVGSLRIRLASVKRFGGVIWRSEIVISRATTDSPSSSRGKVNESSSLRPLRACPSAGAQWDRQPGQAAGRRQSSACAHARRRLAAVETGRSGDLGEWTEPPISAQ
jgi:hypothetical protein